MQYVTIEPGKRYSKKPKIRYSAIWVGIILILLFVLANNGGIVLAKVFVIIYLGLLVYSLFRKLIK